MADEEPIYKSIARLRGWLYENPEGTRDLDRLVEARRININEAEDAAHWIEFYTDTCELAWDSLMVARFRRAVEILRGEP